MVSDVELSPWGIDVSAGSFDRFPGCDELRRYVGRVGEQNDDDRRDPDELELPLPIARREVIGDRQRVGVPGGLPQAGRDHHPVKHLTDRASDHDPDRAEPLRERGCGQSDQQPRAHVARLGAHSRHPRSEAAPPKDEIREPDPRQNAEIENEDNQQPHGSASLPVMCSRPFL